MACFADINVSQGSVATRVRCGRILNTHLTANLHWFLKKSVKISQNYGHESVAPVFLAHPVYGTATTELLYRLLGLVGLAVVIRSLLWVMLDTADGSEERATGLYSF